MNIREPEDLEIHRLFQDNAQVAEPAALPVAQVSNVGAMPLTCTDPLSMPPAAICAYSTLNPAEKRTLVQSTFDAGESALHLAAKYNHTACFELLLNALSRNQSASQREKLAEIKAHYYSINSFLSNLAEDPSLYTDKEFSINRNYASIVAGFSEEQKAALQ